MTDGLMQTGGTSRRVTIRFSGLPSSGFIINKGQSCEIEDTYNKINEKGKVQVSVTLCSISQNKFTKAIKAYLVNICVGIIICFFV